MAVIASERVTSEFSRPCPAGWNLPEYNAARAYRMRLAAAADLLLEGGFAFFIDKDDLHLVVLRDLRAWGGSTGPVEAGKKYYMRPVPESIITKDEIERRIPSAFAIEGVTIEYDLPTLAHYGKISGGSKASPKFEFKLYNTKIVSDNKVFVVNKGPTRLQGPNGLDLSMQALYNPFKAENNDTKGKRRTRSKPAGREDSDTPETTKRTRGSDAADVVEEVEKTDQLVAGTSNNFDLGAMTCEKIASLVNLGIVVRINQAEFSREKN